MRVHRSIWVAILLLALCVTSALAERVTLSSGEQVTVEQAGQTTTVTLESGARLMRVRDVYGNFSWMGDREVSAAEIAQAEEAYKRWSTTQPRPLEPGTEKQPRPGEPWAEPSPRERTVPVWAALLIMAIALFHLLAPEAAWRMSEGWKFRDAEPSDAALNVSRIGGAIGLVIGFFLLLLG